MKKWYSNPIDLSINNAGETGVTITFNFEATNPITSGAYVGITFPTDFSLAAVSSVTGFGTDGQTAEWSNTVVSSTATNSF